MLILMTQTAVANEVLELGRYRLAKVLTVPLSAVKAQWDLEGGKIVPNFQVDVTEAKGLSEKEVLAGIETVWKFELAWKLQDRLKGVSQRRAA